MKAARIHDYGPPDVFVIEDVPRPTPGPGDVLVEIHASSINPVDWKIRSGFQRAVVRKTMPAILGLDFSGVITEVGADVEGFAVGDAVFSSPTHKRDGTYAEYIAVAASEIAHKPDNITHAEAASIPLVGQTAWDCLVVAADLKAGEKVFIEAGSGGVGSFAIQLAKALGATVSTTCSPRNTELVERLGADVVVNYQEQAFEEVLEPQDVVLEAMGLASRPKALAVLKKGGRLTSINGGVVPGVKKFGPYLGILRAGLGLLGYWLKGVMRGVKVRSVVRSPNAESLTKIADLIRKGDIVPVIDRSFDLDDIAEAHRYSESGRARGKIVIKVR